VESEGIASFSQVREKRTSRFLPEVEVRLLKAQRTIEVRKADSPAALCFSSYRKATFHRNLAAYAAHRVIGEFSV
jgi:hypothetical protein